MKKFFVRSLIFSTAFVGAILLELFVLPINYFTFRAWEALTVKTYLGNLPGPFYPNIHLQIEEQGDLGRYTTFAIKKPVEWVTDRYGYRKRDDNQQYNDIVIVGDSLTVGSGLTQDDTLAEILSEKSGLNVYPLAPANMITFSREQRFKEAPPKIVIVEYVERVVLYFPELEICQRAPPGGVRDLRYPYSLVILADRFSKGNMLEFFRARMHDLGNPGIRGFHATDNSMLFLEGDGANVPVPVEKLTTIVDSIAECNAILNEQGIQMIFLPVPNKESIYYDRLPNHTPPEFLGALIPKLRERGITVVDLYQEYTNLYHETGALLYQPDDTHWNEQGVVVAAELLNEAIQDLLKKQPLNAP